MRSIELKSSITLTVNKNVKLSVVMVQPEISYTVIFFMTLGLCVISAVAVCESPSRGKADYCMIGCD